LMRVTGGEENFAFYAVLGQSVFGLASFLSPIFFLYLIPLMNHHLVHGGIFIQFLRSFVPQNLPWIALYWIFSAVFLALIVLIGFVQFPKVDLKEDEKVGPINSYLTLIKHKTVWIYFFGILCYVGIEQSIANWMSKFLNTYHGIDPNGFGATRIAWFWGTMSIGCLIGLLILKLVDSKIVLKISSILTIICLTIALLGSKELSILAFPACGFFISMIFSILFSLALNSESLYHGSFSGILCSGLFGGALIPLIIGSLGDHFGLKFAMFFLFIPLSYILAISFWAKPLINNKTIRLKELFYR
jgi:fucose permease